MSSMLQMSRRHTELFIADDPTTVELQPSTKTRQPGGGYKYVLGAKRPPQDFKIIFQSGSADGIVESEADQARKYDFVIVGKYNAEIEINDVWEDVNGDKWIVTGFAPFNSYETKAMCVAFSGGKPNNG